jgi:hypothetical protein
MWRSERSLNIELMKTKQIHKTPISKLEAALRQLETAIILWFNHGDPISIHTLASAAHQIIYDINKARKGPAMSPDSDIVKPEHLSEWRRILKAAPNFMKHADKDPNETILFAPEFNDYVLLGVCRTFPTE